MVNNKQYIQFYHGSYQNISGKPESKRNKQSG